MHALAPLFLPKSVALVGASPDKRNFRGRLVSVLLRHRTDAPIYFVSPSHKEIEGVGCYVTVREIPAPVDLAILAIPAAAVSGVLEECGCSNIKAVLIVSSGFADENTEEGKARQEKIKSICLKYGMRLLGPNSEGFLNTGLPLAASFSAAVTNGEYHGDKFEAGQKGIALVSQSGGVGFGIYSRARLRGLRFTHVVAAGNQALLGIHDFVEYVLQDPDTNVIVVVLEGLINPSGFLTCLELAAELRKPVIVCKIGRFDAGVAAVTTHTGALAGNYQAYQAVFRRYGVQETHNIAQLIDTACCFCHLADRLPAGRRVGILTPSGGAGIMLADKCEEQGLEVNELDSLTRRRLAEVLPPYASLANPVDITAQGVIEAGYAAPLKIMLACPELDAAVVVCATYSAEYIAADMESLRSIRQESDKPVLFCTYTAANPDAMKLLVEAGFPVMTDMQNCASALSSMVSYQRYPNHMQSREAQVPNMQPPPVDLHQFCEREVLCEYEVKSILADLGLLQLAGFLVRTAEEAVDYFEKYASPVAMKIQSPDIPHKTDTGGVLLNLDSAQAVRDGFCRLMENGARYETGADIHGVLLEPMSAPGIEMLIGISPDKDFGLMLSAGAGGVMVEVMDDVAVTPVPVSESQARYLLEELKIWKLLAGYRGNEPADVTALINLMVGLSRFAEANKDHIREIELNPVIVHTEGQGLTVVDALVINRHRGRTSSPSPDNRDTLAKSGSNMNETMMENPDINVGFEGHVAIVELCRPPDNYFDAGLIQGLADIYEKLDADPVCRAIVQCSRGKHFCAGFQFNRPPELPGKESTTRAEVETIYGHALRLYRSCKPVVAAVQGAAIGGGLGLALVADFRITCADARFSANFSRLGFHHGFGLSVTLPRLVGHNQANLMLFTGRRIDGETAVSTGLADQSVAQGDVRKAAIELAAEISGSAPLAVQAIRKTQRRQLLSELPDAVQRELAEQTRLKSSADFREGISALTQRRPPRFSGE